MAEPEKIGKYRIDGVLGKGAMGVVYKGFDPGIERSVAIKTVRKDLVDPDLAMQVMARFKNEAKAAGRLLHPNIVSVYEYGEDDANAFIAMEYVDGTGLREYLNRKASFDLGQIVAIVSQVLEALDFAHERGVVHRDVKPANLILTASGAVKVADFGIARIDTSNLTNAGMVMGTPSYMSPEQCQGKDIDRRSDLFSTGVVLYELLTGEKPFGGSIEAIAFKICYEDHRPPSEIAKLPVTPALDAIVAAALAKSPEARFQNARAFNRALRQALDPQLTWKAEAVDATELNLAAVSMQTPATPGWDDTILQTVERQLARILGPMAKVIVRKAAAKTGDTAELYTLTAESIADVEERRKFLAALTGAPSPSTTGSGMSSTQPISVRKGRSGQTAPPQARSMSGMTRPLAPLDQEFVDQTTSRLAIYLGPVARIVAKKAAQKAGTQQEFVHLVAGHLGAQERGAFLRELGYDDAAPS
ncbi:MAG TPA: serine/threonine-protein kinase [Casimicrobiaceae bacterium]|nr:serine/threonine-protein kinase [Casimicrobiaceae bacterium]